MIDLATLPLTPYQLFQLERYGDILPDQPGTGGYHGPVEANWWENQVALRELQEPVTGTQTIQV